MYLHTFHFTAHALNKCWCVQMGRYSSPNYWCVMYRWLYTCTNRNLNQSVLYGLTWQVTARVWHIWVFPVRNSPNISVILPVSTPPPSSLSSSYNNDNHTINVIDNKMSNWSNQHISAATYRKQKHFILCECWRHPFSSQGRTFHCTDTRSVDY